MYRSATRPSPLFYGLLALTVAGGVIAGLAEPLDPGLHHRPLGTLGVVLLVLGGWAVSLTLHEFGHAFVAYKGGDLSVAHKGYLTMDVRRYTDPALSIVLPVLFLLVGGIPLPGGAVWINRGSLRSRATASWVSLAGPFSNLVLGIVLTVVVSQAPMSFGLTVGLSFLAQLQLISFVLNILPIPGLDGYGAIEPYLSPQARMLGMQVRPWAPMVLFVLLIAVRPLNNLLWQTADSLFNSVGGDGIAAEFGYYVFKFWSGPAF